MLYMGGRLFAETDDEEYEIQSFPSSNPELEGYKISRWISVVYHQMSSNE